MTVNGLPDIVKRLQKRSTFEVAASELLGLLRSEAAAGLEQPSSDLFKALTRCRTILKTRFTSPAFWQSGRQLCVTVQELFKLNKSQSQLIQAFLLDCEEIQQEAPPQDQNPPHPSRAPFLFEGQLSQADEAPPRPQDIEDLLAAIMATRDASDAAELATEEEEEEAEGGPTEQAEQANETISANEQSHTSTADRPQPAAANLAALEAALLASLEDVDPNAVHRAAPPASKQLVKKLPREHLTHARLQELGPGSVQCSVCRDELDVGDEVQILPCNKSHVFHPPCLAPWLKDHNSCPVCRHELPTDDWRYEDAKEQKLTRAQERRAAANANSHSEFLYI
ncbi:hypothetical protein WJX74_011021 [Apatococcus lobatus]|uniref:RING-type E3 ubiquitin transferase n=1 Tax=Apatococcus lobatus TaxID=904363 RepID=A0AAW1S0N6_9CHLO